MTKGFSRTSVADVPNNASSINTNLTRVNEAFENTLSLDGSTPNSMAADFDLDNNDLLNVNVLNATQVKIGGASVGTGATVAANGGLAHTFNTQVLSDDPGNGQVSLNNATLSSVTAIYVDNLDTNGDDISAFVDTWDESTNSTKAKLTLRQANDATKWAIFDVTAVADSTGYRTVTVSHVASNTLFDSGEILVLYASFVGDVGATGSTGSAGSNGTDGNNGGLNYTFSTTTTDADPGAGIVRYNNATLASVTEIYIDNADSDTNDVSAFLDTWTAGTLLVRDGTTATKYAIFTVTGVADSTGYRTLTVSHVDSGTLPSDAASLVVEYAQKGATGATGAAGATGATGAAGATGATGAAGATGATGAAGADGADGADGATGATGADGVDGADGADGAAGADGADGATGATGATGADGADGADGAAGLSGGFNYTFSTTVTDADPGAGNLRFDNVTIGSVTGVYISETDDDSRDLAAYLASVDGGRLIIRQLNDATKWAALEITAMTDNTDYIDWTVTVTDAGVLPDDAAAISVEVIPGGAGGSTLGAAQYGAWSGYMNSNYDSGGASNWTTGHAAPSDGVISAIEWGYSDEGSNDRSDHSLRTRIEYRSVT